MRLEGLAVLVASSIAYAEFGCSWKIFALCFLLPDMSFAGYLAGARVGAIGYNAVHSYVSVILAAAVMYLTGAKQFLPFLLIWTGHIGFDRALGYGLKYATGFGDTHLGKSGKN